jgi:hypothetical protein
VVVIRELAENANTYQALGPDDERVMDPRYVIWLGAGSSDPHWTVVQRLRLADREVGSTVTEIRELVASRGRSSCTWEIADSATPVDLVDRLLGLGCVPDDEPLAVGMVLTEAPGDDPPGVTARRVESLAEYRESLRLAAAVFGIEPAAEQELLDRAPDDFAESGKDSASYLAFVDGRPVARATAAFTSHGVLLFGGATLEDARGRGAYRALVRARWDDAVARGTPVLVTHAGSMSRPILARLGFREVSRIHILLDRFGER